MANTKERKNWIDWMKAVGMLTIVWGHCFPEGGVSEFLYAFNVPLFFIISGGSMVILEFHREFLHPMMKLTNRLTPPVLWEDILMFILAVAATLAFVPIILILKKYFPVVLGRRAESIKL